MYVFIHMGLRIYMYAYMSISVHICINIYVNLLSVLYVYITESIFILWGARSVVFCCGTAIRAGRSRIRFSMVAL